MTDWNYADVWETVADVQPEAVAITQGVRNLSWDEFDHGADGIAQFLLDLGVVQQDKVGVYLYNSPEYLQATFAAMKVGLVPVNTNYRYGDDELIYLWDNADVVAVVFHGVFSERIERILERVPGVKGWLWVDDGSGPCPDWATPYEDAAKAALGRTRAPWGRSGDDLYMLYTGGTTGMPKGVMWRQDDLFARLVDGGVRHYDVDGGIDGVRASLETSPGVGATLMPACPLMHGTGSFTANTTLAEGGRVCLLESRRYDPVEMLDTIEREKVNGLVIVGDPFSRPLLAVLDENPGRWDLSSLVMTISSGAMWSEPVKEQLLAHHPMLLVDVFSSSEAARHGHVRLGGRRGGEDGVVHARTRREGAARGRAGDRAGLRGGGRARARRAQPARVLQGRGEVGTDVQGDRRRALLHPGRLRPGRRRRHHPPARSGVGLHQLGGREDLPRGGGGGAQDAPGRARRRRRRGARTRPTASRSWPWSSRRTAPSAPSEAELIAHVKERLAHYKAPRRVRCVATIGRAPNGKVDYKRHRAESMDEMGAVSA